MNYFDNFRRLLSDVKNPSYDGRARYGSNAIKLLKIGTALYEFTPAARTEDDKFPAAGSVSFAQGERSDSVYTSQGFGKLLIENSVIARPETWRERVRFAIGFSYSANDIITHLVDADVVTAEQIKEAAIAADKE
jgi:hypothetical protein